MGLTSAKDVDVGTRYSSCAVLLDGSVACWGGNTSGQLGDGTTTDRLTAVSVVGLSGAAEVVVGGTHTCARLSSGEVSCWGSNEYGQVSNGNAGMDQRLTPTKVPGVSGVKQIILSNWSTPARMSDGTVWFWGYEGNAATSTAAALPSKIEGLSSVVEIYPGWHQRCARKADASVWCWGENSWGQVGDGSTEDTRTTPVKITFE
jgi:alpha-tubulin suppressor-like RCC1 family protein